MKKSEGWDKTTIVSTKYCENQKTTLPPSCDDLKTANRPKTPKRRRFEINQTTNRPMAKPFKTAEKGTDASEHPFLNFTEKAIYLKKKIATG